MSKYERAFSLVEVLIVVAIVAVIAIFTIPNFFGGKNQADLNGTVQQIAALARSAESNSANQDKSASWGIHFDNTDSAAPYYAVFSGSSYASGTVQGRYPLPPSVAFSTSNVPAGSSTDVVFSEVSGDASQAKSIGLYLVSSPSQIAYISVASSGAVTYSLLTGGSPSQPLSSWSTDSSMPYSIELEAAVASGGRIYVIAGIDQAHLPSELETSTVSYATVNGDGTLAGGWSTAMALPYTDAYQTAAVSGNHIYVMGGLAGGGPTADVDYATIEGDGSLSSWSPTASLPGISSDAAAAVYNGRIYVIGGFGGSGGSGMSAEVNYATIEGDGTLNSWSLAGSLPSPIVYEYAVVNDGRLYVVGGLDNWDNPTSTVIYATIEGDGTLSGWSTATSLPTPNFEGSALVNNNQLYVIGGNDGYDETSTVIYATINNSDGTLGGWSAAPSMPGSHEVGAAVVSNGRAYVIGGDGANGSSTYYASFQ